MALPSGTSASSSRSASSRRRSESSASVPIGPEQPRVIVEDRHRAGPAQRVDEGHASRPAAAGRRTRRRTRSACPTRRTRRDIDAGGELPGALQTGQRRAHAPSGAAGRRRLRHRARVRDAGCAPDPRSVKGSTRSAFQRRIASTSRSSRIAERGTSAASARRCGRPCPSGGASVREPAECPMSTASTRRSSRSRKRDGGRGERRAAVGQRRHPGPTALPAGRPGPWPTAATGCPRPMEPRSAPAPRPCGRRGTPRPTRRLRPTGAAHVLAASTGTQERRQLRHAAALLRSWAGHLTPAPRPRPRDRGTARRGGAGRRDRTGRGRGSPSRHRDGTLERLPVRAGSPRADGADRLACRRLEPRPVAPAFGDGQRRGLGGRDPAHEVLEQGVRSTPCGAAPDAEQAEASVERGDEGDGGRGRAVIDGEEGRGVPLVIRESVARPAPGAV